jgi:hypothetical protein
VLKDVVPGDWCEVKDNCFGKDKGNVECTGNSCEVGEAKDIEWFDDKTPEHRYCPPGYYCGDDGTNKGWLEALAADADCSDTAKFCKFGLAWVATNDDKYDDFKCTKFDSLEKDNKFKIGGSYVGRSSFFFFGTGHVCKTFHAAYDDETKLYTCRPPFKHDGTDYKKSKGGEDCQWIDYDDPKDGDGGKKITEPAHCGYNTDVSGYCDKKKGDETFVNALNAIKEDFSEKVCHIQSTLSNCTAYSGDKDKMQTWKDLNYETEGANYANIVDNADCTKRSITIGYWGEERAGFAFQYAIVSFTAMMFSVAALF